MAGIRTPLDQYQGNNPLTELTALVALIRRACGLDSEITPFSNTVKKNFQNWIMRYHAGGSEKFNDQQMQWLHAIRDHIASSFHFERDDLEITPFDAKGGLGGMYQQFGDNMDWVIAELNRELVA